MAIHDSYPRRTPFELLLPTEEFAAERFPLIRREAEERGADLITPEAFLLLSEAALALREIRPEDDPPEMFQQFGALLFQAFHFWEAGHPLFFLDTQVARFVVAEGPDEGRWEPALPGPAGYVQFPQHLFWTEVEEGEAPESLDGFFWAAPDGEKLTLLLAMGIRRDRPGLAVVPLPSLPLAAAVPWASMKVRESGGDFGSSLPGAEVEGLYGVGSGAEMVKLAMRVFWYLSTFPGWVVEGQAGAPAQEGEPAPSKLAHRAILMEEG